MAVSPLIGFPTISTHSYHRQLFVDTRYFFSHSNFICIDFFLFHVHECMEETGFASVFQLYWHLVFLEEKRNTQISMSWCFSDKHVFNYEHITYLRRDINEQSKNRSILQRLKLKVQKNNSVSNVTLYD